METIITKEEMEALGSKVAETFVDFVFAQARYAGEALSKEEAFERFQEVHRYMVNSVTQTIHTEAAKRGYNDNSSMAQATE